MDNNSSIRTWSELYGLTVVTGGKRIGKVEDFYLEPETNAVRALRINMGIYGYRTLQASAIGSIGKDTITIANENMLAEEKTDGRLPALLHGKSLLSYKVEDEKGNVVGKVQNILLDTSVPIALRVVGFQLGSDSHRAQRVVASEITGYGRDTVYILDKAARRL